MKPKSKLVITISRQMGCGGASIGQQLARKLKLAFIDREIVRKASKILDVNEDQIESLEERTQTWWESVVQSSGFSTDFYIPTKIKYPPTDMELFRVESDIIKQVAIRGSAVIIGRCGFHILRDYPGAVRILLYADASSRRNRIMDMLSVSDKKAKAMMAESDKKRSAYIRTFTGKDWNDASQYDLAIDTGKIGVENTPGFIMEYLKLR